VKWASVSQCVSVRSNMNPANRKVVLGLGNLLNRDEGLGVQALKLLDAQLGEQPGLELLDGGVLGLNLLMIVEECSHLLILDAVNVGQTAGTLVELRKEQIPLYAGVKLSQHQVTFQEVLGLANVRGYLPEHLHLIGIQPEDLSIGLELSPTVEKALPGVVYRAMVVLENWGLLSNKGE
jgi:hydrogenase maturation protease